MCPNVSSPISSARIFWSRNIKPKQQGLKYKISPFSYIGKDNYICKIRYEKPEDIDYKRCLSPRSMRLDKWMLKTHHVTLEESQHPDNIERVRIASAFLVPPLRLPKPKRPDSPMPKDLRHPNRIEYSASVESSYSGTSECKSIEHF